MSESLQRSLKAMRAAQPYEIYVITRLRPASWHSTRARMLGPNQCHPNTLAQYLRRR